MRNLPQPQQAKPYRKRMPGPWYCAYVGFLGHKKWRRVETMTGVHLAFVHNVALALFEAARTAAKDGWIGSFAAEDCAAATNIPVAEVAKVWRALLDIGWIVDDHIVDWMERQPYGPDTENARERQQRKRDRDKVARKVAAGIATADEIAELDRLKDLSRVMAAQDAPQRPAEIIGPFEPLRASGISRAQDDLTEQANEVAARVWLFGDTNASTLGIASFIIAEVYNLKRLSADWKVRRWADEVEPLALAQIISAASEQQPQLTRANFRCVVEQAIGRAAEERKAGKSLPFGPTRLRGGSAA